MLTLLQAIEMRRSVRTFAHTAPEAALLRECAAGSPASVRLLPAEALAGAHLGTYGVISGVPAYAAVMCDLADTSSAVAAGMAGERLVLEAVRRGLGTVWLGATFDRRAVERALGTAAEPCAVIAVGNPAGRMRLAERIMHMAARSASRHAAAELVIAGTPDAAALRGIEAARLAPSARNRQPWRFAANGDGSIDVYALGSGRFDALDCGIALCHFLVAAPAFRMVAPRNPRPSLISIATLLPELT